MPTAKIIAKDGKEVKKVDFKPTGKPLPRTLEIDTVKYIFESRSGDTYIYKED